MVKKEYDFLSWTSFPSSGKIINDREIGWERWEPEIIGLPVTPNSKLTLTINVKQIDTSTIQRSHIGINRLIDGIEGPRIGSALDFPPGRFDWRSFTHMVIIPSEVNVVKVIIAAGPKGTTWFDDLKIYQDDVLIYSNDFSNWAPIIIPTEIITGVVAIKFIK